MTVYHTLLFAGGLQETQPPGNCKQQKFDSLMWQGSGAAILDLLQQRREQQQKAEELRHAVERRLRLRRLASDPAVSHDRYMSASILSHRQ